MSDIGFKVGLMGNPNSGKSSLFNILTGLRQKVGNFPGVTVEKKEGIAILDDQSKIKILDFPGTYSLFPNSHEERIVVQLLTNQMGKHFPDVVVYVADATQLERHMLFATQLIDLGVPMIFCLNMYDLIEKDKKEINSNEIEKFLGCQVVPISTKSLLGVDELRRTILKIKKDKLNVPPAIYPFTEQEKKLAEEIKKVTKINNPYFNKIIGHHFKWLPWIGEDSRIKIGEIVAKNGFENIKGQIEETLQRFKKITPAVEKALRNISRDRLSLTDKIDQLVTHPWWGVIIFLVINFLIFQAIYAGAEYPMEWIENGFASLGENVRVLIGNGWFSDLLVDGVIAGLGGIMVFIPQIFILFFVLSILEEIGYMSRAVFLFDGIMQKFGLNGRSVVALISSGACAIPAIMSTRTITDYKEKLITILVAPLISCSARIPVYVILIGFVVQPTKVWGVFNAQGLAFMGLYLLGIIFALISALAFKYIIKSDDRSMLMIELPQYRPPLAKNKVMAFIVEAGRVILIISIILWFLASYGPSADMTAAEEQAIELADSQNMTDLEKEDLIASNKIEASYAGHLGKFIEPVIRPMGFDWKIGISLITSFAAREVFVGTMATIYSVGSSGDDTTIRQKMGAEINPDTGGKRFDFATSLSLLIFYVFAMQCMSTLAVTKKETNSWKWPVIQFAYMSTLAYVGSVIVYQLFS
jgi:ferrous iron transport protein B